MLDRVGGGFKEYAAPALRLGLALILILYGARLLPPSDRVGELVALAVTLLGGLFILIGFLTRWAAAAVLVWSAYKILNGPGASAFVHFHSQLWLALLSMSFALFGLGGGKWSLDVSSRRKKDEG